MSNPNDQLRRLSESWIIVSTVLLALELTAVTFTIEHFLEKKESASIYLALSGVTAIFMGMSLAVFLASKDPRQKRYSVSGLIDKGVLMLFISAILGSITLGYGTYIVVGELPVAIFIFCLMAAITSILYVGIYRKVIHGRELE